QSPGTSAAHNLPNSFSSSAAKRQRLLSAGSIVRQGRKVVIEPGSLERISQVQNSIRLSHKIWDFYESPSLQNNTNPVTLFKLSTGIDYECSGPLRKCPRAATLPPTRPTARPAINRQKRLVQAPSAKATFIPRTHAELAKAKN